MRPPRFETRPSDGYERWRSWEPSEERERYVYVHRLLATLLPEVETLDDLAGMHVHHRQSVPWLNTLGNLELEEPDRHGAHHRAQQIRGD